MKNSLVKSLSSCAFALPLHLIASKISLSFFLCVCVCVFQTLSSHLLWTVEIGWKRFHMVQIYFLFFFFNNKLLKDGIISSILFEFLTKLVPSFENGLRYRPSFSLQREICEKKTVFQSPLLIWFDTFGSNFYPLYNKWQKIVSFFLFYSKIVVAFLKAEKFLLSVLSTNAFSFLFLFFLFYFFSSIFITIFIPSIVFVKTYATICRSQMIRMRNKFFLQLSN